MSNKLSFIKGTVVSVSHIFYHSGLKTFFLSFNLNEEKKDDQPTFLMIQAPILRTKDLHKILVEMQLNSNQFIGKKVMVENVARNNLTSKVSQINLKVYLLTKTTTFEILEDISTFLPQPTLQNLVNYEGIVTNDQLVNCGLFVLDNKVIVCQSTLCVITNIRKVKLGMKVAINNVHTIKLKSLGKIGMILCARGRLDILKDQGDIITGSIHSNQNDQKLYEENHIIRKVLDLRMSAYQVFALYEALSTLETTFTKKKCKKLNLASKFMVENSGQDHEKAIKFFEFKQEQNIKQRSLPNQFLSEPHICDIQSDKTISVPNFVNITEVMEVIRNSFAIEEDIEIVNVKKQPCSYRYKIIPSFNILGVTLPPFICGILRVNPKTGMYQLTDDQNTDCDGALDVILSENSCKEILETPCIVKITKFMACKEVMTVGSAYKWNYLYLIVTGFEILCPLSHRRIAESQEIQIKWSVKLVSHPMNSGVNTSGDMSVLLAVTKVDSAPHGAQHENFLRVPAKFGLSLPLGCQIATKYEVTEKKFSSVLNKFLKDDLLPTASYQPLIIDIDHLCVSQNCQYNGNDAYDIKFINQMPEGELLNVEGVVKEKWLELEKFRQPSSDAADRKLLNTVNIELKLISSNETNATTCVSLYIRQWDSKADLYGLVRGVRLRFHSIVKVTSKKSNPYLVTTLFSKVDILDGNMDCQVFKGGKTKLLFFLPKLKKVKENFCIDIVPNSQVAKFDFQSQFLMSRNI